MFPLNNFLRERFTKSLSRETVNYLVNGNMGGVQSYLDGLPKKTRKASVADDILMFCKNSEVKEFARKEGKMDFLNRCIQGLALHKKASSPSFFVDFLAENLDYWVEEENLFLCQWSFEGLRDMRAERPHLGPWSPGCEFGQESDLMVSAIRTGSEKMVQLLLDYGADPNQSTAWTEALHTKRVHLLPLLHKAGAKLEGKPDRLPGSSVHEWIYMAHKEFKYGECPNPHPGLEYLLEHGVDPFMEVARPDSVDEYAEKLHRPDLSRVIRTSIARRAAAHLERDTRPAAPAAAPRIRI